MESAIVSDRALPIAALWGGGQWSPIPQGLQRNIGLCPSRSVSWENHNAEILNLEGVEGALLPPGEAVPKPLLVFSHD
jgi:hypothetical protein